MTERERVTACILCGCASLGGEDICPSCRFTSSKPTRRPADATKRAVTLDDLEQCPWCLEEIRSGAFACKHCGRDMTEVSTFWSGEKLFRRHPIFCIWAGTLMAIITAWLLAILLPWAVILLVLRGIAS